MFLPNELLSDITNFIPDDDVKNLTFLSRSFATVTAKRLPIISVKNKILFNVRRSQWSHVGIMMAKYNYDPRFQSPNPHGEQEELSFCKGDKITIYGEMNEDGFYFGELNGKLGLVPSNFLYPDVINSSNALISPQAKAWIFSVYQFEFYPYMAAQNHIVPTKILSDISNFISDDDVKNLTFVSRALAVVMMKKLPIIEAKNKVISRYMHIRTMIAKWDYDPRIHSPNADGEQNELSFCSGDLITVYGEMDKEGFYFGTLNGVRGLVPSNFLPSNLQDLQPWEIIRILYKEDPELTMERRDRISANFHFDKILVEEYWSLLIHRNKKGKLDLWDATSPKQTFLSTTKTDNYRAVTRYRPPTQTNPAGGSEIEKSQKRVFLRLPSQPKECRGMSHFFATGTEKSKVCVKAKVEGKLYYSFFIHFDITDDDVKNLVLLSRAFATVTAKRLPIISVKNKILFKFRRAQWPPVRIMMAKHNYDPRVQSPNVDWEEVELSFCKGDKITVYGEMDEDGFYFGELNGARGLVPSNFLDPTIAITIALMPPEAKALIYSFYQYEFYPYMAAQNHSVPTKILSDITNFIPDGDVKNLGFVSRSFAYVITKRCAIIKAKNKILFKARRAQWPRARIMIAKWDYNPRVLSRNVDGEKYELSFRRGDRITIFSDVDEDGFYLGELNGARGKVPSNFLEPADPNTPRVIMSPQAKAWIFSYYPYMAAQNRVGHKQILSDISIFVPDTSVKILGFVSREFAAVTSKRLPIIKAQNKILLKARQAQCPSVRIMIAKWNYDARHLSPNVDGEKVELSFCSGDQITVYGEMNEDGSYFLFFYSFT